MPFSRFKQNFLCFEVHLYVHFIIDVERIDVVGIGLSVVFLTPQMLGLSMNPNMEPVNIQRSFTLREFLRRMMAMTSSLC